MSQEKLNILYLDDDAGFANNFIGSIAMDKRFYIEVVATGDECISKFYERKPEDGSPKWDGFIFDAVGVMADGDSPNLTALTNVYNTYEGLDSYIKKPFTIFTAQYDDEEKTLVEKQIKYIDPNYIFEKNKEEELMLEYLYSKINEGDEHIFKLDNQELCKILNSKYFIDKKENYIANYLNINKSKLIEKTDIRNEIHGMRNLLERTLNHTAEIYEIITDGESDMIVEDGLAKKITWLRGSKSKENNYKAEPRALDVPEYIGAIMSSINAVARVGGSHEYEEPTKKTLDGLLFQVADVLLWFGEEVMKKRKEKIKKN